VVADPETYRQMREDQRRRQMHQGGSTGGDGCGGWILGCFGFFIIVSIVMGIIVFLIWWRSDDKDQWFKDPSNTVVAVSVVASSGKQITSVRAPQGGSQPDQVGDLLGPAR
jgi:hypothetical protein